MEFQFDEQRIVARTQGRQGWLREARRQLEQDRWRDPDPIRRSRLERLLLAAERLEQELDAENRGNTAYEEFRERRRQAGGHRVGGPAKPHTPPQVPDGKVNVSDPDTRRLKAREGYVQGYNAQAVVDQGQIVLAAEITNANTDWSHLDPMVSAALAELERAGVQARPQVALADTQYWNEQHMDEVIANKHVQVLIPPESNSRKAPRPGWSGGRYAWMRTVLASDYGHELYKQRKQMVEPVFGHTRHNRGVTRFLRQRTQRRADRVAITDGNPQPDQAAPPPDRHRRGLNGPGVLTPARSATRRHQRRYQQRTRRIDQPDLCATASAHCGCARSQTVCDGLLVPPKVADDLPGQMAMRPRSRPAASTVDPWLTSSTTSCVAISTHGSS